MAQAKELKVLAKLATQQLKMEEIVADCETKLEEAKAGLKLLKEETFPETMARFDLTDITIAGKEIKLVDDFRCNFPSMGGIERAKGDDKLRLMKRQRDGIAWMKKENHVGLLKSKILFEFGIGENVTLEKFKKKIEKAFPKLHPSQSDAIHPATLKKFLKELGEDGIDYPKEVFGVSPYKRVEVTT